ncbi:MAG: hypothetical protein ACLFWL_03170 [Candidatus Brocadiia bacterium]
MAKIRDHLWLWCHEAGSHDGKYGLPGSSDTKPAEAAEKNGYQQRYHGLLR